MYNAVPSSNQGYPLPAPQAGGFHVQSGIPWTEQPNSTVGSIDVSNLPQPVAKEIATVAQTVGDQIEVARIQASLRGAFSQVLPNPLDLLSTGVTGDRVGEYASLVRDLTAMRNIKSSEMSLPSETIH